MNFAAEILNYFEKNHELIELLLIPGSEIIQREGKQFRKLFNRKLTARDVKDTLISLRSNIHMKSLLQEKEIFSFGMPYVGRIRVSYIMQRGSYVLNIMKVPYYIPEPKELFRDPIGFIEFAEKLGKETQGIYFVIGEHWLKNAAFNYSLLNIINKRSEKFIYVLEHPMSYLIKHESSIIIQRDVDVDVRSFEEGIEDASILEPDLVFIGKNISESVLPFLNKIEFFRFNLLSFPIPSTSLLKKTLKDSLDPYVYKDFIQHIKGVIKVELEEDEKINYFVGKPLIDKEDIQDIIFQ